MTRDQRPAPDPADSAIEVLASARWMREPDWPSLKEKLMSDPRSHLFRRQRLLITAIALAGSAVAAAAAIRAYELLHFSGTMQLDDGSTVQVEGDVAVEGEGENATMNVTAEVPSGATAGGEMNITLPTGARPG